MSDPGFVHLHLHSQYSLLDGAIRIQDLLPAIQKHGMPAVAVTDHGNMYGTVHFYKTAKKNNVKPLIGCEAYVAGERGRKDRSARDSAHLVLLAKDNEGYRNLKYLISMGFLEGFYYNPRIDKELLREHAKGLFGLSACLGGGVAKAFAKEGIAKAEAVAREYQSIFEPESFFLELQDNGFKEQQPYNEALLDIAKRTGIPLVATADAHYLRQEDAAAHEVLMCIQQGLSLKEFRERSEHSDKLYVKTAEEMWRSFGSIAPEALDNTVRIAQSCNVELDLSKTYLPRYQVPEGCTLESYLEQVAYEGLKRRISEAGYPIDEKLYRERLAYELGVIIRMKFPGYFLIVWDFIRYAKEHGIPVGPGRGSGAGSLVAWCLRITDLDPIPYDLLFERFLNPERVSMPDFDVDFCQDRRGEVINYVGEKYGRQNVGQIVTYSQLSAKSVIKDVGRVMELPFAEVNELTKLIPGLINGKKVTIDQALELEPKLKAIQDEKPVYKQVIDIARSLEGLNRQTGIHAAGVVIGDKPLWEYVPICCGKESELVTQFAKEEVEAAGLVKFDFLGLKTLTVIANAVKHIRKRSDDGPIGPNRGFDIGRIPLDDAAVYNLIATADTDGVFQLESSGFKEMLKRLKPDRFEDIVAGVALYRPGPLDAGMVDDYIDRKHGRKPVTYPHPVCESILKPTYGVIVYQEQVMRIAVDLSGFTMGEADVLRKAMGKKKADVMADMRRKFVDGAHKKNGMPQKDGDELFTQIEKFAGYAFNKCIVGETRIIDADSGEVTTVEDLYLHRRPFRVHAVGADEKLGARAVTDVVCNGRKRVYELRTAQGKSITATATHRFRTLSGWKRLADLRVSDAIAAPRSLPVKTKKRWARHEVVTLAGLLAEGNTCHPSTLYYYNHSEALVRDFAAAASSFDDTVARIESRAQGGFQVVVNTGKDCRFKTGQQPWNAVTCEGSAALAAEPEPMRSGAFSWAAGLGILDCRATEKRVPAKVFELRDADLVLFLGRLWAGDGFIANRTQAVPFYATSSQGLARDVQTLLLRLGILSGVHRKVFKYRGGAKPGYTVHLLGEGSLDRFLAVVAPHCLGRESAVAELRLARERVAIGAVSKDTIPAEVRDLVNVERQRAGLTWREVEERSGVCVKELYGRGSRRKKGFRRDTIATLARFFAAERIALLAHSDLFWDRIVAIEPRGVQQTYDLTVEHDHNFIADGLVVHNSHSAAYAVISYQTGYLKTYYPVEFMAALLSTEMRNQDQVVKYIHSCRERRIAVLPPDVNRSEHDFSVVRDEQGKGAILFGLGAVKGLGDAAIDAIEVGRKAGPFASLYGFCERVDVRRMNRKVLEVLVKSGACDRFGKRRSQMFAVIERALEASHSAQRDRASGQTSLFAMFAPRSQGAAAPASTLSEIYPDVEEWTEKDRLSSEKEAVGFYVTGHPLDGYAADLQRLCSDTTASLAALADQPSARFNEITIAGVVTALRERPLKNGTGRMAFVTLEDLHGHCEVLVFSKAFGEAEPALKSNEPVLVHGIPMVEGAGAEGEEEGGSVEVKLRASAVELLSDARAKKTRRVELQIPVYALSDDRLVRLKELLTANKGEVPTRLTITEPNVFETVIALPETLKVRPTDDLLVRVDRLFGQKVVRLT